MITEIPGLTLRVHTGGTGPAALMAPIANAVYALNGIDEVATVPELENRCYCSIVRDRDP